MSQRHSNTSKGDTMKTIAILTILLSAISIIIPELHWLLHYVLIITTVIALLSLAMVIIVKNNNVLYVESLMYSTFIAILLAILSISIKNIT